ncbi:MAG TPA: hypothetical protein VK957_04030 [Lunatimonas sp.]|nr:hypothetical protein [Lunatimonas sp.]
MKFSFFILILVLVGYQANSQGILQFEGYGGPSVGFYNATISSPDGDEMSLFPTMGYQLGLGVVGKVTDQWQVVLQGEYLHRPIGIRQQAANGNVFENKDSAFGNNFGNYSLGARYTIPKQKFELYVQPAIGVALNRDPPNFSGGGFGGTTGSMSSNFLLRFDVGIKKYTKRNNYFLAGLRYQQGVGTLDELRFQRTEFNSQEIDFSSNASYVGVFIGFGISTDRWFK